MDESWTKATNVISVSFWNWSWIPVARSVQTQARKVQDITSSTLPLDPQKIVSASDEAKEFLTSLHKIDIVGLHHASDVLDDETHLIYRIPGEKDPYMISLIEFMWVMKDDRLSDIDSYRDDAESILGELLQRINIHVETVYFAPRGFPLFTEVDEGFDIREHLDDLVYVPWKYFYAGVTDTDQDNVLWVDPYEMIDLGEDATLLDLIAKYMEHSYEDDGDDAFDFRDDTVVILSRYSYTTKRTLVIKIRYTEIEELCIAAIRARYPLFKYKEDYHDIVSDYLDRSFRREDEGENRVITLDQQK